MDRFTSFITGGKRLGDLLKCTILMAILYGVFISNTGVGRSLPTDTVGIVVIILGAIMVSYIMYKIVWHLRVLGAYLKKRYNSSRKPRKPSRFAGIAPFIKFATAGTIFAIIIIDVAFSIVQGDTYAFGAKLDDTSMGISALFLFIFGMYTVKYIYQIHKQYVTDDKLQPCGCSQT